MYRARYHFKLKGGNSWNEFLAVATQFSEVGKKRGWAGMTFWTQVVGPFNEIVIESEYADLASFERESKAIYADEEAMKAVSKWGELLIEGAGHNELWMQAEPVTR
jgi:ABC-type glycerol-3-phosphate transport system substrate-binding protein